MRYTRLVAEIKILPIYQCDDCDAEAVGTTAHYSVDTDAGQSIEDVLSGHPRPRDMPVGWASYGVDKYRCSRCMRTA